MWDIFMIYPYELRGRQFYIIVADCNLIHANSVELYIFKQMNLIFQKWNSKFSILVRFLITSHRQFFTLNISIIMKKLIDDLKSQLTNRFW